MLVQWRAYLVCGLGQTGIKLLELLGCASRICVTTCINNIRIADERFSHLPKNSGNTSGQLSRFEVASIEVLQPKSSRPILACLTELPL